MSTPKGRMKQERRSGAWAGEYYHSGDRRSEKRPIRVLHLIKGLNRGGAEVLLLEGGLASRESRYAYSYAYLNPDHDTLRAELETLGGEVWCVGARNPALMLLKARRVAQFVRQHQIDILHCHLPLAGVVGRFAGRLAGVPVVYTEHNKVEYYRRATFLLNRLTYAWQDHVVAVSDSVCRSIYAYLRPSVPVTVIRNGIDTAHYVRLVGDRARTRSALSIPPDGKVVGIVASFTRQKRLDVWLEAAQEIAGTVPNTYFLLVGEGPLRRSFEQRLLSARMRERIRLVGAVPDVRPYLAAMDVYLMTSAFEGLPVSLLEAMAMECAPVCTAVGGIPEVIRDGQSGYLAQPGDSEALSRYVCTLLESEARRLEVGKKARQAVLGGFDVRQMVGQVEGVYDDVLQRRVGAGTSDVSS
jgi:L-malate glycosyltransferase